MIGKLTFITSECRDPFRNLAFEEYLTMHTEPGEMALFLWKNRDTIVFGRNQDILAECRVADFQRAGGKVVRRLSGGGTVYHDEGNLNFTFAVRHGDYDVKRQLEVILGAVRALGIDAGFSGRNDLVAKDRKFSGNAFYRSGDYHYHHGTLLVDSDVGRMTEFLTVDREKLKSRGVRSVSGRVVNLRSLRPWLTTDEVADALRASLERVYGGQAAQIRLDEQSLPVRETADLRFAAETLAPALDAGAARYSSDKWNFGTRIRSDLTAEARFGWGGVKVVLETGDGMITDCRLYSDAMDPEIIEKARQAVIGARCSVDGVAPRLKAINRDGACSELIDLFVLLRDMLPERKDY